MGYIIDNYIQYFVSSPTKKPPIINRGYWARVRRFHLTIFDFFERYPDGPQLVHLGAGFDTLYWLRRDKYPDLPFKYVELDFAAVCRKKIQVLSAHEPLSVPGMTEERIVGDQYFLLPADLRQHEETLQTLLAHLNPEKPVLFLCECVLVYLEPEHSDPLLDTLAKAFAHSAIITYDIIQPDDPMGRTMRDNLAMRNIYLKGISVYPTVESHLKRFSQYFERVEGKTMLEIYNSCLDADEKRRVEAIEWMDEFEEWNMLLSHYCIILASKGQVELTLRI